MTDLAKWRPLVARYKLKASGRSFNADALTVEVVSTSASDVSIRVRLALPEPRRGLTMRSLMRSLESSGRIITGDDTFDQQVCVHDDPSLLMALDFHTRRRFVSLAASGVEAYGGGLVLDPWATEALADPVDTVAAMFELLSKISDASPAKVVRIIQTDPVLGARDAFAALFEKNSVVQTGLAEQRVRDIAHASEEGFASLSGAATDQTMSESVRLEAIERLLAFFPLSRVMPVLETVDAEVVNASVEFLTRAITSKEDCNLVLPILLRVASRRKLEAALAARLVVAVAETKNSALLPVLAALVDHGGDSVVARDALTVLMGFDVPALELERVLSEQGRRLAETLAPQLCEQDPKLDRRLLLRLYRCLSAKEAHARARYLRLFSVGRPPAPYLALAAGELENTEHGEVRQAAIEVLANLGERSHIGALRPFTEGLLRDAETKNAARSAISRIKERHPGEGDAGSVSVATGGGEVDISK